MLFVVGGVTLLVVLVFGFWVGVKAGAADDSSGVVVGVLGGVHGPPVGPIHIASAPCPCHLPAEVVVVGVIAVAIAGLDAIGVGHDSAVVGMLVEVALAQCLFMHACIAAGSPMCVAINFHVALSCAKMWMSL